MPMQGFSLLDHTIQVTAPVTVRRFVGFNGTQASVQGQKCLGVAMQPALAAGQYIPVTVAGSAIVECGGVIAAGATVISDNVGRAITNTGALAVAAGATAVTSTAANGAADLTGSDLPEFVCGYALQASSAAGQFIEVLLRH